MGSRRRKTCCTVLVLLAAAALDCPQQGSAPAPPRAGRATADQAPVEAAGVHNVFRVTEKLYSGSSPEGDEGFRSLQRLGVRTILSVDGARPDIARARAYGMRYVHLPIGYDGVPRGQALRIAKAVERLPGRVYLHCHHGQHRGPAAAAVARVCLDARCSVEAALAGMRRAGTDERYTGLYAAPRDFRRPTPAEWDRVATKFPEVSEVAALAQIMVGVDERWGHLEQVRAAGWKSPPDHPDLDPPHEALQLAEHFREAARLPQVRRPSEEFRRWLADAEAAATELERALRDKKTEAGTTAAEPAFRQARRQCTRCHARFRDVPQEP